ncbi:MAG TPA: hypothetical protein DCM40_45850 [Maribacter sp.]|nr:hypothetical protein [Maribacter sp.]
MEEESTPTHLGKKWKNDSFHSTFEQADAIRQKLLRIWVDNPVHEGMEVKVKYMPSRNRFVVKTRRHPDFDPKPQRETKKNGKGKRRNKKNTDRTKFDPTAGF